MALGRPALPPKIADRALNAQYENAATEFFKDHPFLKDNSLRNPVFSAAAIARCACSNVPDYNRIAREYADVHAPSYHLLYMMRQLANERVSVQDYNMLIQSCSDFLSLNTDVSIQVTGESWDDDSDTGDDDAELEIRIEPRDSDPEIFSFLGSVDMSRSVSLGPVLVNAYVVLPCQVNLQNSRGIHIVGRCHISAPKIGIDIPHLDVLGDTQGGTVQDDDIEPGLFIDAREISQTPSGSVTLSVSRGGALRYVIRPRSIWSIHSRRTRSG